MVNGLLMQILLNPQGIECTNKLTALSEEEMPLVGSLIVSFIHTRVCINLRNHRKTKKMMVVLSLMT